MITGSIVTYKNSTDQLNKSIQSFLNSKIDCYIKLYVINNSPNYCYDELVSDERIEYIVNSKNIGFGAGHNIAIRKSIGASKYHLVLNPDIYFTNDIIKILYDFMEENSDIGLVAPRVLFTDGQINYICRLIPTPLGLIVRRFIPFKAIVDKRDAIYELKFSEYEKLMDVPCLSGCFMFIRTKALEKAGIFDERFFLYLEDVDLSRRIHRFYRTVFYPNVTVYHEGGKLSYKNKKVLIYHIFSAIKYFNKYGWFYDKERAIVNKKTLQQLGYKI